MSVKSPLIEQFVNYLRFERHFSPYTARCYEADLRQYGDYLAGDQPAAEPASPGDTQVPVEIDAKIIADDTVGLRAYLTHLDSYSYSPATVARKIATLRSFHKWLCKHGAIAANPMLLIRTPKQTKRLPKAMTVEEVDKLLSIPDNRDTLGARDRAILETLYSTGVRVSELVDLNRNDLDQTEQTLHVRGKGKRERIVPLGSHALPPSATTSPCSSPIRASPRSASAP
jgi:site-specific recombinase XerD